MEGLVERAAEGDERAWQALWSAVEPELARIVAQPRFLGRLGQREDERRDIIVAVMARLRADGFARLRRFLDARAQTPALSFMAWLRVVAKRVGIDYLRAHPDYVRRYEADRSTPGVWIEAQALPSSSRIEGVRTPVTARGTAKAMLAYAAESVPAEQCQALELWASGEDFDAIAGSLALASPKAAERSVRAAIERLRRRFRAAA